MESAAKPRITMLTDSAPKCDRCQETLWGYGFTEGYVWAKCGTCHTWDIFTHDDKSGYVDDIQAVKALHINFKRPKY